MKRKKLLAILLSLAMCLTFLAGCGAQEEPDESEPAETPSESQPAETGPVETDDQGGEATGSIDMSVPTGTALGDRMEDFTFTTYDGNTYSLYETLAEKKMVLVNIWATWCGPCQAEFPFMEEAYEAYQDDIQIFALSCEETDSDDVLADYVADMGMTFPVGRDTPELNAAFEVDAIPTSIVVDRFGVICLIESGSQTSVEKFNRLFDVFVADDYTQPVLLDGVPQALPTVEPTSEADLAQALNAEGGELAFRNSESEYDWPFAMTAETDAGSDRTYLASTNAGQDESSAVVEFDVDAAEGDVLALDYAVSTESGFDFMVIYVDDEPVKYCSGERDWAVFACTLEAGPHTVTLAYEKDEASSVGNDQVCFDNVRLVSGQEAEDALAAMPAFPHGEETAVTPADPAAREIVFDDPEGYISSYFGTPRFYIIPGEEAAFHITLAPGVDPDAVCAFSYHDGSSLPLADLVDGDHYSFTSGMDSVETTGYSYCYMELQDWLTGESSIEAFFFVSEENVNAFLQNFLDDDDNPLVSWTYADGSAPGTDAIAQAEDAAPEGYSAYTLSFVDQNGDPVEGIIANVCDDSACTPMTSDADGLVEFTYPSFAYHIQVIKVPDGYDYDTSAETYLDEAGGLTTFEVTKN